MKNNAMKGGRVLRSPFFLVPLLFAVLTSCGGRSIVNEEREFGGDIWNCFTPEVFEAAVSNTGNYYNLDLTVSVDTAVFRYESLPLTVNIYSPNGEHRMFYSEVPLKENGRWKGEAERGLRTVGTHMRTFFSFNGKGTHRIEIGQATSQYDLEGIHSIKLDVYKVKLDYGDL